MTTRLLPRRFHLEELADIGKPSAGTEVGFEPITQDQHASGSVLNGGLLLRPGYELLEF